MIKMTLTQKIKEIDLASLVQSTGTELGQRGNGLVGLCPIHNEVNPSFYVYPSNRFKCYG
jgi:DNA primase